MTIQAPRPNFNIVYWLANQPYLLLSLTSLFWATNIILGRVIAGQIPPVTLTTVRWFGAFLIMLPFAVQPLRKDFTTLRKHLPLMALLAATGFVVNNVCAYWGLQYTIALNALLMQSSGPLFVALWSLVLFGVRLTVAQFLGILTSLFGVLVILLRGDLLALRDIDLNTGDLLIGCALLIFGLYSALMPKRPATHPMSLIVFTAGLGSLMLMPFAAVELASGASITLDAKTVPVLIFLATLPSAGAYIFFNRGIALIGPNRAAPFFHLMPVFGSVMAIVFLDERPEMFHLVGYLLVLVGVFTASRR